ncbi:MAG: cobalt ECF transporter T component CbiQ [Firmicutes bacterium]|nr:cobalt ECF transporter T component CbiQ [Bacillota bacterium]
MLDIRSKLSDFYSLEQLAAKQTYLHKLHPIAKIIVTLVYIVCVVSFPRYNIHSLMPYIFYPLFVMAFADIPFSMILKRAMIALPFCLFAGISNILFDTGIYRIGTLSIGIGWISCIAILIRSLLSVCAILILVAITPFSYLMDGFRQLHTPNVLVLLFEMTYRYIAVLVEEASTMLTSYRLRYPGAKWPVIQDFGPFIGQLFIRSYQRAQRVYAAMQCRLYALGNKKPISLVWKKEDTIFVVVLTLLCVVFRMVDLTVLIGGMLC